MRSARAAQRVALLRSWRATRRLPPLAGVHRFTPLEIHCAEPPLFAPSLAVVRRAAARLPPRRRRQPAFRPIRRQRCSRSGWCGLARARRQTPPCAGCSRAPRATFTPSSAHRASRSRHVKSTSSSACCCTPTLYNHGTRRNEIKSQPYFRLACCGRWRLPPQPPSSRCPIVVVCCEVGWVFSCSHLFL